MNAARLGGVVLPCGPVRVLSGFSSYETATAPKEIWAIERSP